MKRLQNNSSDYYYFENIQQIDERICQLIIERRIAANKNPVFPPQEMISSWAKQYDLYENLLEALFGLLRNEEDCRPPVVPQGFIKNVQVLKTAEKGEFLYTIPFIRQYENASVVSFQIDWELTSVEMEERMHMHRYWELYIDEAYDCRIKGGGGSDGHLAYQFTVSPPLPDDLSGTIFKFKEYSEPYTGVPANSIIEFNLE
ncbi:hypothetical protein [Metabacillus indicus]|uniref:hypothetical protein n=1 Tax=Metabacillus indicus TaxID=246786 RepID=UPI003CF1037F